MKCESRNSSPEPNTRLTSWCSLLILSFSLCASDSLAAGAPPKRSQEPTKPYPYRTQDVLVQNTNAGVRLAGTLSIPRGEGPFPGVLLISGSGPQNRDEEILGHRPFLVLSDHLARHGIAVLRMDDRGVGQSTGDYNAALNEDFAQDAVCEVRFLRSRQEIMSHQIGLIGHSAGGVIAPLAAQATEIDFMVLLASPGLKGVDFVTNRDRFLLEFARIKLPPSRLNTSVQRWQEINRILMSEWPTREVDQRIRPLVEKELQDLTKPEAELFEGLGMELKADIILREINTPWYRDNLRYDPQMALRRVKCPVLALYGDKDIFVPAEPNSRATKVALESGGNRNVTVKILPDKNHFFQTCKTGMPIETYRLEETMAPSVLDRISDWIASLTRSAGGVRVVGASKH